jgi:UDP-glucuronate 4-epimerase|tara:strand:+ start:188 stop:1150 length:963 start_codon:yes stop_codon:yes gene_type:complete
MKILVTGCAGFIGFHLAKILLERNKNILGIDNLNNYYDVSIKKKRLQILKQYKNFKYVYGDLKDVSLFKRKKIKDNISHIYHFAGQAGVRYSIKKPSDYIKDNTLAYLNLLENFKNSKKLKAIFYASSSSVYGNSSENSSSVSPRKPISVYAVSKLSMELLSQAYLSLYNMRCIGLRFFTVYGPWGRPDMAYFKFCKLISKNKKIEIYNNGKHYRSFTYIDDAINNLLLITKNLNKINFKKESVFNIGNPKTESLKKFVSLIEKNISIKSKKIYKKKQLGDVLNTRSNNQIEKKLFKFKFQTDLEKGIKKFINWFLLEYE